MPFCWCFIYIIYIKYYAYLLSPSIWRLGQLILLHHWSSSIARQNFCVSSESIHRMFSVARILFSLCLHLSISCQLLSVSQLSSCWLLSIVGQLLSVSWISNGRLFSVGGCILSGCCHLILPISIARWTVGVVFEWNVFRWFLFGERYFSRDLGFSLRRLRCTHDWNFFGSEMN